MLSIFLKKSKNFFTTCFFFIEIFVKNKSILKIIRLLYKIHKNMPKNINIKFNKQILNSIKHTQNNLL